MNKFIAQLDLYFGKKAPQLPASVRLFLVRVGPYLTILAVLVVIPAIPEAMKSSEERRAEGEMNAPTMRRVRWDRGVMA